jgi:hypothetical protein
MASPFEKACLPVGRGDCRRPIGPLARREGRFLGGHFLNVRDDELVKSHIPYVVHASTKPVLSEPSTLRQAQGERWVEAPVLSEPSTLRQAQGERWVEAPVLSEPSTLRQAQGERWVEAPVLSEPSTLRPFDRSTGSRLTAQGERWVEAPVLSEPFTLSRSKGDAEFLRDHHLCLVRAFARNPAHSGTSGQLFSR